MAAFKLYEKNCYEYDSGRRVVVNPAISHDLISNPGIGICTYQRFNGDPVETEPVWNDDGPLSFSKTPQNLSNGNFPASTVAYFRWYWARIEPEEGVYRWELIDKALDEASKRAQMLHFRIMPHDHTNLIPSWYKGLCISGNTNGAELKIPDYSDPYFQDRTERLVSSLGARYDGHQNLYAVDIGTLGHWGEWHCSRLPGEHMMDSPGRIWAVDVYLKAFRKTPLLMPVAKADAMSYAISKGAGWRADSWGDLQDAFCNMKSRYPWALAEASATDSWKHAPVSLECAGTLPVWKRKNLDLSYILEEAQRWHASTLNLKSTAIPEEWRTDFDNLLKKSGYRFELRQLDRPATLRGSYNNTIKFWWVNSGNAPVYRDVHVLIRLQNEKKAFYLEDTESNLRTWLPGDDQCYEFHPVLPHGIRTGDYDLSVALAVPGETKPFIRPANQNVGADGWLNISKIAVIA